MDYQEKYDLAVDMLSSFNNYLEVSDFRKFLLLILNLDSVGPEAMLKQLGMGSKGKTILPYDPSKNAYYTRIMSGFSITQQLVIYSKTAKLSPSFVNKAESVMFTKHLTSYERKNLLPSKFIMVTPEVIDFAKDILVDNNSPRPMASGIESLYMSLPELIASQNLKFIFLIEGEKADLVFTMNTSYEPNHNAANSIQYFDVYVDEKKELRGHTFIQMKNSENEEEVLKMEVIDSISEIAHAQMFDSHFTIIVPVTSLNKL